MGRTSIAIRLLSGLALAPAGCAGAPKPAGPLTGGWVALLAPDVAIAPGAIVAGKDLRSGDVKAICAPAEWLSAKEGEPLPEPDIVGSLAPSEMRDELEAYVKAHGKGSKTPPLVDLGGRSIDRQEARFGRLDVVGYLPNTLHPWSRTGVKEGCLSAITSHEDGSMRDGTKLSVAVVTRVLIARPAPAAADAGAPAPDSTGASQPVEAAELRRTRKGYLEGEGVVWAIQYEPLAPAK